MLGLLTNKYVVALGIIIITLFLAKIANKIIRKLARLSAKSQTKLDDLIVEHVRSPIRIIILTVGLFIAFKYISPDFSVGSVSLEQIFAVFWILAGALLVNKIVNALFRWYTEELQHKLCRKVDDTIFMFMRKVVNILIYIFALLAILNSFGIEITPMLAGLGIGGIAIALALKDTLANVFAAVYITADRPMKIGDYIELDAKTAGYVHDIGWRTTRMKTWDGNYIIIPNAKISEALLRNYDAPKKELEFFVACSVSYNSDLEKVEQVAVDVAEKVMKKDTESYVREFEPYVRFKMFGDSAVNFNTYLKIKSRKDKSRVRHEFIKALHKRFAKEKIEIPFPQIDIHRRK